MVRDEAGIPHHFAPTSGILDGDALDRLAPTHNVVESFIDQGVIEPVPDDAKPMRVASIGHAPEAMQYVAPSPKARRGAR